MSSGGILSTLRVGLMECIPVLEKHRDYLRSMVERKEKKKSEASTAVDCVVKDISEREKITILEIGADEVQCEEVKLILDQLLDKDFYQPMNLSTLLPVSRWRRYSILNKFLIRQTPVKLGLWTFDNHGTSKPPVRLRFLGELGG